MSKEVKKTLNSKKTTNKNQNNTIVKKLGDSLLTSKVKSFTLDGIISKSHWTTIMLVELIGTFLLVSIIIAPLSVLKPHGQNTGFLKLWEYKIWIAIWISFGIFLLICMFGTVSANFNPAVTIVEIYAGNDTVRLGLGKIGVQFVGSLAAAFMAYGLAENAGTFDSNSTLGASTNKAEIWWEGSAKTVLNDAEGYWWIIILLFESVGTFILLWTVFGTKHAKHKNTLVKKSAYISLILVVVIWVNDSVGSPTINPSRTMMPAFVSQIMGGDADAIANNSIHVVGQMIAALSYGMYVQKKSGSTVIY